MQNLIEVFKNLSIVRNTDRPTLRAMLQRNRFSCVARDVMTEPAAILTHAPRSCVRPS